MTLIEQLTSVAIVGILSAIAAPSWHSFVIAQEVGKDAEVLQFNLHDAKREAIKKKSQLAFVLAACRTADSCWQILQQTVNQASCIELSQALIDSPYLQSVYKTQDKFALFEDGSCLPRITYTANPTALVPSVLPVLELTDTNASSSQPSSVQREGKNAKTANGKNEPTHRGSDRRDKRIPKKATVQKVKYKGCFHNNGTFRMQKDGRWFQVDFSTLPENWEVTATGKSCTQLGVQ